MMCGRDVLARQMRQSTLRRRSNLMSRHRLELCFQRVAQIASRCDPFDELSDISIFERYICDRLIIDDRPVIESTCSFVK